MLKAWTNTGICAESELYDRMKDLAYTYYIAYQTDQFLSGSKKIESLERIEWGKLLEIRLFSEKSEFLARRTMIGGDHPFQWRIASEEGLEPDEYITRYQTLDIDNHCTEQGEFGNLRLTTTGGGHYELPVTKEMTCVKVISYVAYGEDGMAHIYDDRLAGFTDGGEM